ncbi:ParB/RepB/Spo0J family partition protein [Bifidobacterium felsineum]|uniref:Chromosome partitioning protein ParB n=1 Tax=Bifidobacterium felsineum TaxID=2045440 RepID=A0A2M9HL77_9BIFI|nr:ParB/RepB/Spo0J family partition protein [Bifidobacterium felsineum]MBT1163040.1 ParB/RepB/Spo0J family partition protein [Bifidobacterium felsineum]PJM77553.1 chromosome partitioning protein ParB [Bifidobacterium felsineum]
MSSKSRLGKGLGALFPDLPGEETVEKQVKSPENAKKVAETKSASKVLASAATSVATPGKASTNVKKNMAKRAAMPALDDIAHPSDLFFGSDSPQPQLPVSDLPKNVSRETSKSTKTAATDKSKNGKSEEKPELKPVQGGYLAELKLSDIGPNAHQPRTIFDEDELNELSASIKEVGVLQPIVVRKRPVGQIAEAKAKKDEQQTQESSANLFAGHLDSPYELIMGERRWRASQLAGLKTIPAIVKTTADDDMLRDALLENLHRVALNPLEEAAAYQQMIDEFGLTQAQLSKSVSKSRPQIANMLRLLNLPAAVQKKVAAGVLSSGHARALLGLSDPEEMDKLASRIISEGLSVRSTEEIVAMKIASGEQPKKPKKSKTNPWVGSAVQQSLENHFDTKVSIKGTQKHGRIEIVFSSPEDMDRILKLLVPNQSGNGDSESKWV